MAANANDAILRGVAGILQDASAALARLGMQASGTPGPQDGKVQEGATTSLADAAAALQQVASQFTGGAPVPTLAPEAECGDVGGGAYEAPIGGAYETPGMGAYVNGADAAQDGVHEGVTHAEPSMSTADFCGMHALEAWIGEALDLLNPEQRFAVMDPPLNTCHARNLNGIVVSRIKQAVPLAERLGIFVEINGLSEGVVDRISTLTPEQAEAMMESGLKLQKATNPSGVAMRRISDVLRGVRPAAQGGHQAELGWDSRARERSRTPAPLPREALPSDTPDDVQQLTASLGLEWWCGEVLKRLSLWQRQQVMKDLQNLQSTRNPSGVIMSRVRQFAETSELMSIFIDINQFDSSVQQQLWTLTPEQQSAVINPGIYLQNVRNPSTAVRSRIKNVLAGNDAFGKPL